MSITMETEASANDDHFFSDPLHPSMQELEDAVWQDPLLPAQQPHDAVAMQALLEKVHTGDKDHPWDEFGEPMDPDAIFKGDAASDPFGDAIDYLGDEGSDTKVVR